MYSEVTLFTCCLLLVIFFSLLVTFCLLLAYFCLLLVTFCSLLVTFCWLLVKFCSLLVTFCLLLVTFCLCFVMFCPLLVTFCSLLITFYLLLVTFYLLLVIFYLLLDKKFWMTFLSKSTTKKFSILICTKGLICDNLKTRIVLNWRFSAIFMGTKDKIAGKFLFRAVVVFKFYIEYGFV